MDDYLPRRSRVDSVALSASRELLGASDATKPGTYRSFVARSQNLRDSRTGPRAFDEECEVAVSTDPTHAFCHT
jgi:hypothetical protein